MDAPRPMSDPVDTAHCAGDRHTGEWKGPGTVHSVEAVPGAAATATGCGICPEHAHDGTVGQGSGPAAVCAVLESLAGGDPPLSELILDVVPLGESELTLVSDRLRASLEPTTALTVRVDGAMAVPPPSTLCSLLHHRSVPSTSGATTILFAGAAPASVRPLAEGFPSATVRSDALREG